jgi:cystathionine beta-lyase
MADSTPASSAKGKGNAVSAGKAVTGRDIDGHELPPSPAPSSPHNGRKYALMTELVYTEGTDQYNASSVPIYQVCCNSSNALIGAAYTSTKGSR